MTAANRADCKMPMRVCSQSLIAVAAALAIAMLAVMAVQVACGPFGHASSAGVNVLSPIVSPHHVPSTPDRGP
jgi:hypothetical protein